MASIRTRYVRRSQGSPGMPPRQRCPPPWVVQVPLAACGWALVYEVTRASKADRQQRGSLRSARLLRPVTDAARAAQKLEFRVTVRTVARLGTPVLRLVASGLEQRT